MLGGRGTPSPDKPPASAGNSSQAGDRVPPDSWGGGQIMHPECQESGDPHPCLQRDMLGKGNSFPLFLKPGDLSTRKVQDAEPRASGPEPGLGAGRSQCPAGSGCAPATHRRLRCSRGAAPPPCSPCPGRGRPPWPPSGQAGPRRAPGASLGARTGPLSRERQSGSPRRPGRGAAGGQERGGAGTPPAGQGRSRRPRPLPG